MHIVFCTSSFKGGGITSYAHEVINSFSCNNRISVILGDDSHNPININNADIYRYDMSDCSINNAIKVINLINNVIKPNVIINSNAKLVTLISPYINDEIKIVSVSHSLKYIESDIASINHKYIDKIIALSHFNKKNIIRKFFIKDKNKINVIYNFVNEIEDSYIIRENKKNNNILSIVFAGGTSPSKSPEIVFKIINKLIKTDLNFKFYWLGPVTPPLKKIQSFNSIKEIIKEDQRITFTGKVTREKAIEYINNANIFIIPSKREGCPIALLESLRVGSIVITSDFNNGCKEIINNNKNGFIINHNDINGFIKLITDIISNHNKYSKYYDESYMCYKLELSYNKWKQSMDQIIYDDKFIHKKRFPKFNSNRYILNRFKVNLIEKLDYYEMLIFEIFPAACRFFFYNLKYKLTK